MKVTKDFDAQRVMDMPLIWIALYYMEQFYFNIIMGKVQNNCYM